jgi:DNA-binding transcriptional LysR family regulator
MELPSIDLNLLVALHALLRERNVTRAGEGIGLSQPAMSAALGRLRRHFGDDLLVRDGQRYVLTPLATSLLDQTEMALRYVESTFAARPVFNAGTSEREFTVVMSDSPSACSAGRCSRCWSSRRPPSGCASGPPTGSPSTRHRPRCAASI